MSNDASLTKQFVQTLDETDPLRSFKSEFLITDPDICYLDGNSLGRLPKKTIEATNDFLTNEWGH